MGLAVGILDCRTGSTLLSPSFLMPPPEGTRDCFIGSTGLPISMGLAGIGGLGGATKFSKLSGRERFTGFGGTGGRLGGTAGLTGD